MELQAAKVLAELNQLFPFPFELKQEMPGYFQLATGEVSFVFQFNYLPRAADEEVSPLKWQEQRETALTKGQRLIYIWEDQWQHSRAAVISRMAALLGTCKRIHGRETTMQRVNAMTALNFIKDNHLLVPLKGKYRFGLFYKNELRSLAVFSGPRQMKAKGENYRSFELLRFCHSRMHLVTGGLSKLLWSFAEAFRPQDIMTYVDLDWSEGKAFLKNGFMPSGKLAPQVFWINPEEGIRYSPKRLPSAFVNATAEKLHEAGYYRICNSGSLKFIRGYEE
ncbi:hypothetical protein EDD80_10490 [Anseongella ginsenosidimutans]|uniref:Uncharacterized protein n=1 Tax=Anseongella ginsenosidimutans TaxID=496056 RepID=A0A4R3KSD5_9SPHI|nr:hypothetical protein [Anseongella ginsenosidimutans]QEC53125.1 hypothetical protein FRZ59_12770 [Anseongella ginsenosidimutans]TCS87743.1 hypothetical protein EDD80_10490 [Anseongella ginsenosidimutans]